MAESRGEEVMTSLVAPAGDEEIRSFLAEQFGAITPELWRWFFRRNPHGEPLIAAARSAGTLVGGNALVMRRMARRGEEFPAAQDSYLVTHSGYRRRGIMRRVVTFNWEKADRRGLDLIFIFQAADNASLPGFIRCGGVNLGRVGQRIRVLDAAYLLKRHLPGGLARLPAGPINAALRLLDPPAGGGKFTLVELIDFDDRFTRLWHEVAPALSLACVRDEAWLRYRYLEHPERTYRILGLLAGDRLIGYAVMEHRPPDARGPARTMLVDSLATAVPGAYRALAGGVIAQARAAGSAAIHGWIAPAAPWFGEFRRAGFIAQKGVHGVLVQRVSPRGRFASPPELKDWYLAMGDSDLY